MVYLLRGNYTHSLTDPGHSHTVGTADDTGTGPGGTISNNTNGVSSNISTTSVTTGITISSTGSSATNANLQPYVVVYMWKRTA